MTELTDELKTAFIAAAGWQAEPWRLNAEVADGLVAVLAATVAEPPHPRIVISCPETPDGPAKFDIDVKATGVTSADEVTTLLLLVVEKLTRVSTDGYVLLVEQCRRIAASERAEVGD